MAAAQQAETRGDRPEATRLLRSAADWYQHRNLSTRAQQMLRQARRVAGEAVELAADERLGFGDELEEDGPVPKYELPEGLVDRLLDEPSRPLVEQRGPAAADPALDAWCSFCCRPKSEVGALVAGPAGAFICAGCVGRSAQLVGAAPTGRCEAGAAADALLPTQRRALERVRRRKPRFVLVIGVEGSGKSTLLKHLRDDGLATYRVDERSAIERGDAMVVEVRATPPTPALVLCGPDGEEPIYDTQSLAAVVDLPFETLARVDAVLVLPPPTEAELRGLAQALLAAKGAVLAESAIDALARLAFASGRGVRELVALVARVPAGRYE